MSKYIAAIDQGTTSTRCILFNHQGNIVSVGQKEHEQIYPHPGWVEHNPDEIWKNTLEVIAIARINVSANSSDIAAIGITNQRETTVVWNKKTGKPYYNALVWQDTRTTELVAKYEKEGGLNQFREKPPLISPKQFTLTMISDNKKQEILKRTGQNVPANSPKVSVIIPAYNIANYVAETLDSVNSQTFKDYEVIVINDGSPDSIEFEKVLKPYFESIIYLKSVNIGAGAARNIAIEHSRGELLAFLDGDDVWLPKFLESQVNFLEKNSFDLVYADADLFGDSRLAGKTYMQTSPSVGEATPGSSP